MKFSVVSNLVERLGSFQSTLPIDQQSEINQKIIDYIREELDESLDRETAEIKTPPKTHYRYAPTRQNSPKKACHAANNYIPGFERYCYYQYVQGYTCSFVSP